MFEKYRTPALFLSKDAVLSCYSLGRTTGLTIDIGGNGTTITPVIDGWAETKNIQRSIIGGRYLDAYTLSILKLKGIEPLPLFRLIKTVTQDKNAPSS
jgi:actin-related protein